MLPDTPPWTPPSSSPPCSHSSLPHSPSLCHPATVHFPAAHRLLQLHTSILPSGRLALLPYDSSSPPHTTSHPSSPLHLHSRTTHSCHLDTLVSSCVAHETSSSGADDASNSASPASPTMTSPRHLPVPPRPCRTCPVHFFVVVRHLPYLPHVYPSPTSDRQPLRSHLRPPLRHCLLTPFAPGRLTGVQAVLAGHSTHTPGCCTVHTAVTRRGAGSRWMQRA